MDLPINCGPTSRKEREFSSLLLLPVTDNNQIEKAFGGNTLEFSAHFPCYNLFLHPFSAVRNGLLKEKNSLTVVKMLPRKRGKGR